MNYIVVFILSMPQLCWGYHFVKKNIIFNFHRKFLPPSLACFLLFQVISLWKGRKVFFEALKRSEKEIFTAALERMMEPSEKLISCHSFFSLPPTSLFFITASVNFLHSTQQKNLSKKKKKRKRCVIADIDSAPKKNRLTITQVWLLVV